MKKATFFCCSPEVDGEFWEEFCKGGSDSCCDSFIVFACCLGEVGDVNAFTVDDMVDGFFACCT